MSRRPTLPDSTARALFGGSPPPSPHGGRTVAGFFGGESLFGGASLNYCPPPPHPYGYRGEEDKKRRVWAKGKTAYSRGVALDSNVWRLDAYGNLIKWDEYGLQTQYGWEIDHIVPKARGGSDYIYNLQPLFWRKNASLGAARKLASY